MIRGLKEIVSALGVSMPGPDNQSNYARELEKELGYLGIRAWPRLDNCKAAIIVTLDTQVPETSGKIDTYIHFALQEHIPLLLSTAVQLSENEFNRWVGLSDLGGNILMVDDRTNGVIGTLKTLRTMLEVHESANR